MHVATPSYPAIPNDVDLLEKVADPLAAAGVRIVTIHTEAGKFVGASGRALLDIDPDLWDPAAVRAIAESDDLVLRTRIESICNSVLAAAKRAGLPDS